MQVKNAKHFWGARRLNTTHHVFKGFEAAGKSKGEAGQSKKGRTKRASKASSGKPIQAIHTTDKGES